MVSIVMEGPIRILEHRTKVAIDFRVTNLPSLQTTHNLLLSSLEVVTFLEVGTSLEVETYLLVKTFQIQELVIPLQEASIIPVDSVELLPFDYMDYILVAVQYIIVVKCSSG